MAADEDRLPPLHLSFPFTYTVPDPLPNAPFVPSAEEAEHRYHGLPSQPIFVVRSNHDIWVIPTGMEAHIQPRELRRVNDHPLNKVWEGNVDVAMDTYLVRTKVQYTSV